MLLLAFCGCGDASCPAGTTSIDGRCETQPSSSGGGSGGSDAGDAGGEGGTSGGGSGGMTGGSGGDSSTTDCDDNTDCSATTPQCSPAGTCVSCTSNDACEDRGPLAFCQTKLGDNRGQCVACINDADCKDSDDGEYCNNNACVPCKTDGDCTDLTKPECGMDGQCTGCTSSDACEDRDGTNVCVTEAGPKRGHCVACTENAHCPDAADPECKPTNTCGACLNDDACDDRNGTERCNRRLDADTFGQCVECTGATEETDCDGKSCKQDTGECTEITIGDLNPCESCEADSQCGDGTKCVKHMLGEADLGFFCFYTLEANDGCADTRPSVKPYSQTVLDTLSVDSNGTTQQSDYCLPKTSCEAFIDATNYMGGASPKGCTMSSDCGLGNSEADGAYCIPNDFSVDGARQKCTYACESSSDCPSSGFNTCPAAGLKFCQP